jgi:hypothetical protein
MTHHSHYPLVYQSAGGGLGTSGGGLAPVLRPRQGKGVAHPTHRHPSGCVGFVYGQLDTIPRGSAEEGSSTCFIHMPDLVNFRP